MIPYKYNNKSYISSLRLRSGYLLILFLLLLISSSLSHRNNEDDFVLDDDDGSSKNENSASSIISAKAGNKPYDHRGSLPPYTLVLQSTHTLKSAGIGERFCRARMQIAAEKNFAHHVLLWGRDMTHCETMLAHPAIACMNGVNVTCVNTNEMRENYAVILRGSAEKTFSWLNCDLPLLSWYNKVGRYLGFEYLFHLEYDVEYSGNLPALLHTWDTRTESYLGASIPNPKTSKWPHYRLRNTLKFPDTETLYSNLVQLVRISEALLMHVESNSARVFGNSIYCECRFAMYCRRLLWCSYNGLYQLTPEVFGVWGYNKDYTRKKFLHDQSYFDSLSPLEQTGKSRFHHRAKW